MARPVAPAEMEFPGSDSFLDVVTNIVGILVILVVVVGARARNAASSAPVVAPENAKLIERQAELSRLSQEVELTAEQAAQLGAEILSRGAERSTLGAALVATEQELARRRAALDAGSRRQFDARRSVALAKADVDRLLVERSRVKATAPPSVTVESYPTPISRMVDGKEAHFQLKEGRIVSIPLEELLARFKSAARERVSRLRDAPETVDTVGPIDGFRLRYTLERVDVERDGVPTGQSYAALTRWELMPVSSELGEPVANALAKQSLFRDRLAELHPHQWTVTLWIYQDSFAAFREVRKELYRLGYAVAARPMPGGVPIGGSPQGTRSAAQ